MNIVVNSDISHEQIWLIYYNYVNIWLCSFETLNWTNKIEII